MPFPMISPLPCHIGFSLSSLAELFPSLSKTRMLFPLFMQSLPFLQDHFSPQISTSMSMVWLSTSERKLLFGQFLMVEVCLLWGWGDTQVRNLLGSNRHIYLVRKHMRNPQGMVMHIHSELEKQQELL